MPSVTAIGGTAKTFPPSERWAWAMIVSTARERMRVSPFRSCSRVTGLQRVAGGSWKARCPWNPKPPYVVRGPPRRGRPPGGGAARPVSWGRRAGGGRGGGGGTPRGRGGEPFAEPLGVESCRDGTHGRQ